MDSEPSELNEKLRQKSPEAGYKNELPEKKTSMS